MQTLTAKGENDIGPGPDADVDCKRKRSTMGHCHFKPKPEPRKQTYVRFDMKMPILVWGGRQPVKNMCVSTWKMQIYQTYWYFDLPISQKYRQIDRKLPISMSGGMRLADPTIDL